MPELKKIKSLFQKTAPTRWWGDNFDVRFYLLYKTREIVNKSVVDVGGGIGIICSQTSMTNNKINVDSSFEDLIICKKNFSCVINLCASVTNLPFIDNSFDYVICANMLEIAKTLDIKKNNAKRRGAINSYPTVEKVIEEMRRIMKKDGHLFLTTPNNAYYQSTKLTYRELKMSIGNHFKNFSLIFFNTFPKLNKNNRKLNLANTIPKLASRIIGYDNMLKSLCKNDEGHDRMSVSFYVEAIKE